MNVEVITHFAKDDEDCSCDYYSVDVKIDGKVVRHYGDHYHDKGSERADAFIDGYFFAIGKNSDIKRTNIPDDVT